MIPPIMLSAADPLPWLLEKDPQNPAVRYFALRDVLGLPETDAEVCAARAFLMRNGPVPTILNAQDPSGAWAKRGCGYSPKYRATVWSLLFLAELGADPDDPRVRLGCEYLLGHSLSGNGAFSVYQTLAPSGAVTCLNGNLLFAMQRLGFASDARVQTAAAWLVRAITGEKPIQYHDSEPQDPISPAVSIWASPAAGAPTKQFEDFCRPPREPVRRLWTGRWRQAGIFCSVETPLPPITPTPVK